MDVDICAFFDALELPDHAVDGGPGREGNILLTGNEPPGVKGFPYIKSKERGYDPDEDHHGDRFD
jgi:hypothetical protein